MASEHVLEKKIGVLTRMGYLFLDTVIRRPMMFNRQYQCYFLSVVPGTCRKQRLFGGSGDQGCALMVGPVARSNKTTVLVVTGLKEAPPGHPLCCLLLGWGAW